jgi:PAS domain S-box-containing protein
MNDLELIKVLLVDDDEDDFILTSGVFKEIKGHKFQIDWYKAYQTGLDAMALNQHDICLLDYRLGARNGIDLLRDALEKGCASPIILLTGLGEHTVDVEAMKAGAADYLVKSKLTNDSLERSIRYAMERKRATASAAFEQASLAAFGAEVGLALTKSQPLATILHSCAESMVRYLNLHLARIYILSPEDKLLHLKASAGAIEDVFDQPGFVQHLNPEKDMICNSEPVLINQISAKDNIPSRDWALNEGVVAYSGYPLMLENRLIGLISIYSFNTLTKAVIQEMASVANGIALSIERKRSEEALDASEVKYRSVVDSLKEVVFQVNEFGHWTSLNPAWKEITGFTIEEVMGSLFLEYIHHDDRQRNSHIFLQLMERKLDYCRYETRLLTKNGKVCWIEVYAQLTINDDGSILGASGSLTNITERKQAERQIQKLAAFPQVNPNPVLEFNANGEVTYSNEAAELLSKTLGFTTPLDILPPDASAIAMRALASSEKHLSRKVTLAGHTISWSFFPVTASQVIHCYGADITEIQSLEAQFRHAQKLESVGQLAAGVAHDFNNILTVIQGYSDHLLSRHESETTLAGPLKQISNASRRAAALTRQLLMFSRKQLLQKTTLDLNTVVKNLSGMLPRLLGEDITVEMNYAQRLPLMDADTGMIEQVIMNLAVNSRDAMPKGGKLALTTSVIEIDEDYVVNHPDSRVGKCICLAVADQGSGMSPETMERIFEPFFSTKEVGKGTGLGLATVYGIVKQHHGWIDVKSQLDVGTTFLIYLPASAKSVEAPPESTNTSAMIKGRHETVLLVEDEPSLRQWVKEILLGCDYNVLEANNGVEALKVWDEQKGKIDLLLTDMVMPEGMTGGDLARHLRERQPDLCVVYTSGYSAEILGNQADLPDGPFLSKPYPAPQLTRVVRDCLDASMEKKPAFPATN